MSEHTPGAIRAAKSCLQGMVELSASGVELTDIDPVDVDRLAGMIDEETAAPELLAALAGMVDMFERHVSGRSGPDDAAARWDAARAAIAKAKGVNDE